MSNLQNEKETYYVVKKLGKYKISVFRLDKNNSVYQEVNLIRIMGHYREEVLAFWNLLSEEQKNNALIVPKTTLQEIESNDMIIIHQRLLTGDMETVAKLFKQVWDKLAEVSVDPVWFEQFINSEVTRSE